MSNGQADTPDILLRILRRKAEEVGERAEQRSLRELAARIEDLPPTRGFWEALAARLDAQLPAVIAEIKRASPSKGVIRPDYDPAALAVDYANSGAACLSVLTDRDFFGGDDSHLQVARDAVQLPVLRKDFTIDTYQLYEARVMGADCVLLIAAALGDAQLAEMHALALELGLDVLIEVHAAEELERIAVLGPGLVGINNRDLHTFTTDLATTEKLAARVPESALTVTESGIHTSEDVERMRANGVHSFLVGEALMSVASPGRKLQEIFGVLPAA